MSAERIQRVVRVSGTSSILLKGDPDADAHKEGDALPWLLSSGYEIQTMSAAGDVLYVVVTGPRPEGSAYRPAEPAAPTRNPGPYIYDPDKQPIG